MTAVENMDTQTLFPAGNGGGTIVAAESERESGMASHLAEILKLPLVPAADCSCGLLLLVTRERLELRPQGPGATGSVYVDFTAGRAAHRRRFGGGVSQPLARAAGLKRGWRPRVLDATAGMGRDGFVLAALGCELTLLERSPVIWALLEDGVRRARAAEDPELRAIAQRMIVRHADAIRYLERLSERDAPDVVYLDPMYPHRRKSARVKKEMSLFRALVGDDPDSEALLQAARGRAGYRVVVKRPTQAGYLGDASPTMSIESPNTRYDVYVRKGIGR